MINVISVKALLKKMDVDRTVFTGVLTRSWQFISGPITMLLIASRFSRELQGYYYTFSSLLALQVFVEMGLGQVILQFASHEWSKLSINMQGFISGDSDARSRLVSLGRIAFSWYFIGSIILIIGLGVGGYIFFSSSPSHGISWVFQWFALCILTGVTLCFVPIWSILMGCNQVNEVYFYRLFSGIIGSSVVWISIASGGGLWTGSIYSAAVLLWGIVFCLRKYRNFFSVFLKPPEGPKIKWKEEMFPFQWKIALSWLSGYFCSSLFTPVLFKFQGPVVAGQMGMTWTLVGVAGTIAGTWMEARAPQFGMLAAKKEWHVMDKQILRLELITILVCLLISAIIELFIIGVYIFYHSLSVRFLSPLETGIFVLAIILMQSTMPLSIYLRAHKKEPMMVVSITCGVLIAIATIIGGKFWGSLGVSIGYLITAMIILPFCFYVFFHCRKIWHII